MTPDFAARVPFYAFADIYTAFPGPEILEVADRQDTGPIHLEAGTRWFCEVPGPGCGVSIAPGARSAYGDVIVNPAAGAFESRAGSFACVETSGFARTYGYFSLTFRVVSDRSLHPGDPVVLDLAMAFSGLIDDNGISAQAAALMTVLPDGPVLDYVDAFGTPHALHAGRYLRRCLFHPPSIWKTRSLTASIWAVLPRSRWTSLHRRVSRRRSGTSFL